MNCPVCKEVALVMAERQGIEIDYCPQCRGVWLDRGELDKIIERATASGASPDRLAWQQWGEGKREWREYKDYDDDEYYRRKKKRGFLGELFDFD